ncbi:MAG TPA: TonB-dependent receptor [Flavobacteriales bacterium]|nr:TonB-dependent receptor [Flavobacteriales bacterium]
MSRLFYLIPLLLFGFQTIAQKGAITITGQVTDSLQVPLPQANIILKKGNAIITYTTTDQNGHFEIKAEKDTYILKVTYLGYQSKQVKLSGKDSYKKLMIKLNPVETALDEVVLNTKILDIITKKDTLIYNLKSLTDGSEMTLKDVVQKLPGMRIDDNGKITQNGKPIDKVLINDKEFFNGQHQMATENISADMIKSIKFYQRYKTEFDSKTANSIRALNVDLKDAYKHKITGKITAGISQNQHYKAHANVFKFTKNANLALITDANSLGQKALSLSDYIDFTGGIERYAVGQLHIGNIDIDETSIPAFLLKDDNVKSRDSKFAGLNLVIEKKHQYKFSGFYLVNLVNQSAYQNVKNTYNNGQTTNNELVDNGQYLIFNTYTSLKYKLSSRNLLSFLLTTNLQNDQISNENRYNNEVIFNKTHKPSYNFGVNCHFSRNITDSQIWDTNFFINSYKKNRNYQLNANFPFLDYLSITDTNSHSYFDQLKNNYHFQTGLTFYKGQNRINFKIGSDWLNDELANQITTNFPNNQVTGHRQDHFVGAKIKLNRLQWHLSTEIQGHYYRSKVLNNLYDDFYILPNLSFTYLFNLNHHIDFYYNYGLEELSMQKRLNHYYFNDFETLKRSRISNRQLFLPKHQLFLTYDNFIKKSQLYYDVILSYTFKPQYLQEKLNYITPQLAYYDQILMSPSKSFNSDININLGIIKHHFLSYENHFATELKNTFIDNHTQPYQYQEIWHDFSIYSRYKKFFFNWSIGLKLKDRFIKYPNINRQTFFNSEKYYLSLHGKQKQIKWRLNAGYESLSFAMNDPIFKIDSDIQYQINKNFILTLKGNDILNLNKPEYYHLSINENYMSVNRTANLPGYIALLLTYNF